MWIREHEGQHPTAFLQQRNALITPETPPRMGFKPFYNELSLSCNLLIEAAGEHQVICM